MSIIHVHLILAIETGYSLLEAIDTRICGHSANPKFICLDCFRMPDKVFQDFQPFRIFPSNTGM